RQVAVPQLCAGEARFAGRRRCATRDPAGRAPRRCGVAAACRRIRRCADAGPAPPPRRAQKMKLDVSRRRPRLTPLLRPGIAFALLFWLAGCATIYEYLPVPPAFS